MANLPSTFVKVNDQEMRQDTLTSEAQYAKFGSNDNYLKDALNSEVTARGSGDTTNTNNYNNIKTEVNAEVVNTPVLVRTVTYGPFTPDAGVPWPLPVPIDLSGATIMVFAHAYKFQPPNVDTRTFVRITIVQGNFITVNSYLPYQQSFDIPGISRSDWNYATTTVNGDGQTITFRFYKFTTLSLP